MVDLRVGSFVKLGRWQGKEIDWVVLTTNGDKTLLLSRFGLDVKPFWFRRSLDQIQLMCLKNFFVEYKKKHNDKGKLDLSTWNKEWCSFLANFDVQEKKDEYGIDVAPLVIPNELSLVSFSEVEKLVKDFETSHWNVGEYKLSFGMENFEKIKVESECWDKFLAQHGFDKELSYDTSWEVSSLRKWLNGEFLQNAFDDNEKKLIEDTEVTPDKNTIWDSDSGKCTCDKVWCLSMAEAEKYFSSDEERLCKPMDYVVDKYFDGDDSDCIAVEQGNHWWWLRTVGRYNSVVVFVNEKGHIGGAGCDSSSMDCLVRPAIWVKLNFDK